jgi:hypothetical protein
MDTNITNQTAERGDTTQIITVTVNGNPVTFTERRATGLQIKKQAIDQGVTIQLDFVLYLERGQGQRVPIGDNEEVTLHNHQSFRALAPDDNS